MTTLMLNLRTLHDKNSQCTRVNIGLLA